MYRFFIYTKCFYKHLSIFIITTMIFFLKSCRISNKYLTISHNRNLVIIPKSSVGCTVFIYFIPSISNNLTIPWNRFCFDKCCIPINKL